MRFVTIRDLRSKSSQIQRELPKEKEMILTSNGNPIAILASVSQDTLEELISAFRRARAMLAVEHIQRQSVKSGTDKMSLEEINKVVSEYRKGRNR